MTARHVPVSLIAACSMNRVIGKAGRLPWDLPGDWAFFSTITRQQVLLVGRKSFEEFGAPIPNRHTIIVSPSRAANTSTHVWPNVAVVSSLAEGIKLASTHPRYADCDRIFVGGGERLYAEALASDLVESCYITRVHQHINGGDTFLPHWTTKCPTLTYSAKTTSASGTRGYYIGLMCLIGRKGTQVMKHQKQKQEQPGGGRTPLDIYKQSFHEYLARQYFDLQLQTVDELDKLMALLHDPLPVSFRINLHRPDADRVKNLLKNEHQFPTNTYFYNDIAVNPPKQIAWYPQENVAWQVDCGRVALSKTAPKHANVKAFHSCLLEHTDSGTIDRQEAVSMLPVLFLNVNPGHHVLDMCASPGSKTTQVIDFLLSTDSSSDDVARSKGMVIANDLDKKRAYMLVHRLTRNTLRNAVVTCGAGDTFPGLYDSITKELRRTNVFDRVLCDVPCSGDGTLRKNQTLWREWHIGQGLTLHPTQLALAMRGAALLKVGGMMVYSTCSFNPVENEAVVAELLRRSEGALEVVDVSMQLPGLIYRKGRTKWKVGWRSKSKSSHKGHLFNKATETSGDVESMSPNSEDHLHEWFENYKDIPQELRGHRVLRSMFAPPADAADMKTALEKTLRLIPIDQNSGGFFISVLRKIKDLPGEDQCGLDPLTEDLELVPPEDYVCRICNLKGHFMKNCEKFIPEEEYASQHPPMPKKQRTDAAISSEANAVDGSKAETKKRETLYRVISDDAWQLIRRFYGIQDEALKDHLWCRSDGAANVNYVDKAISDACLGGDALEIVNTGLKVWTKVSERGETFYRPSEEGLGFIERYFTKRLISLPTEDFKQLLHSTKHVPLTSFTESVQQQLSQVEIGPAIAQLSSSTSVCFNVWIGKGALLPRVSKTMRSEVEQALIRTVI